MGAVRDSLDTIINLVDYTNHQCRPNAMIGAALDDGFLKEAHEALAAEPTTTPQRVALLVLLDMIDFTRHACSPFEMVSAVLPKEVIQMARKALTL